MFRGLKIGGRVAVVGVAAIAPCEEPVVAMGLRSETGGVETDRMIAGRQRVLSYLRGRRDVEETRLLSVFLGLDESFDPFLGDRDIVMGRSEAFYETVREMQRQGLLRQDGNVETGRRYSGFVG